jgi:hypothetical protein
MAELLALKILLKAFLCGAEISHGQIEKPPFQGWKRGLTKNYLNGIRHWWVVKKYKIILQVNLTPFPRWFGDHPIIRFPFPLSRWRKGRGATKI